MEQQPSAGRVGHMNLMNWDLWQRAVIALLRADVSGALRSIEIDEVNWDAWHSLYAEGRSPRSAIDRALARDF